jgi:hypothetical protein
MEYFITNKGKICARIVDKTITVIPDNIENIQILVIDDCKFLTKIPNIKGLKKLWCVGCILLKEIPNIKGLQNLVCRYCHLLTKIPNIKSLTTLICMNCNSLKKLPDIINLKELDCRHNRLLTKLPNIHNLEVIYWNGCPWLEIENEFLYCPWAELNKRNLKNLIKLQRWIDRYLRRKKLEKIIPNVTKYWFSPNAYGGKTTIKRLYASIK